MFGTGERVGAVLDRSAINREAEPHVVVASTHEVCAFNSLHGIDPDRGPVVLGVTRHNLSNEVDGDVSLALGRWVGKSRSGGDCANIPVIISSACPAARWVGARSCCKEPQVCECKTISIPMRAGCAVEGAAVVCQEASDLLAGFVDDRHSDSECPVPEERSLVVRDLER